MNHDAERYDSALLYASPAPSQGTPNHTGSPVVETPWHSTHQQSPNGGPSSAHSPQIYSSINHSADHANYTSPSTSASYIHSNSPDNFTDPHQSQSLSSQSDHDIPFTQIEGSIGPSRVQTRRQRATQVAATRLGLRRESISSHSNTPTGSQDTSERPQLSEFSFTPPMSSPQTPGNATGPRYDHHQRRLTLNMVANPVTIPPQSPRYNSTTAASPVYPPYNFYPSHSRSNSTSNSASNPRSASPALSVASALTSVSSSASAHNSQTFSSLPYPPTGSISPLSERPKQRKQRLFNVDRKAICQYHLDFPSARQEDIATRYGVERSTISKILKNKKKWMNVPESENLRVAKHRPSKFPEIEEQLVIWLEQISRARLHITDAMIRDRAKDVAKALRVPDDKFKASAGWIENFKNRHGVRKGQWVGDGKNLRATRALGAGIHTAENKEPAMAPLNSAFDSRSEAIGEMQYAPDMSYSVGDDDPPEPDSGLRESTQVSSLRPTWLSETSTDSSLSVSSARSVNRHEPAIVVHSSISHQANAERHHRHPSDSAMHLDHMTSHQHNTHPDVQTPLHAKAEPYSDPTYDSHMSGHHNAVYDSTPLEVYQPLPPLTSVLIPTFAEAEDALNKVIMFIDSQPSGSIITTTERGHLHQIKTALFQAGSGVPYNRES